MNQQYSYPDDPGHDPVPPARYDLEPQSGYDPTSSMPVMGGPTPPPQQPGYGPPPPAGGMPPAPEPKKSSTGLVLGLLVGFIVLILLAGAGVWYFLIRGANGPGGPGSAGGKEDPFPHSYTVTEKPPEAGETWGMSKPEGYDRCADLNLTGVEKVIPFEGTPEGDTMPGDDEETGRMSCQATMVGETNEDNYHPTGTFYVDFDAVKDVTEAGEDYKKIWETATGYGGSKQLDICDEAEFRTKLDNNVRDVAIAYRVGNVSGLARISVNFSTHFAEPDQEMLTNVLTDVIYSGLG